MVAFLLGLLLASGPQDLEKPFKDCGLSGSCTVYDYQNKKWTFSDAKDAERESLPASTFKIINLLIALETGVIKDENEVIGWVGETDTTTYGYRPEIYKDLTIKEAYEASAVWVFMELAKKIGRERYLHYLKLCHYGNCDLSEKGVDFWNFGNLAISPIDQIKFLVGIYEGKLPFSARNLEILKRVMVSEQSSKYVIRSKTGWSRLNGKDVGWWVGYVERKENAFFFATRVSKSRSEINPNFSACRKEITKKILRQLKVID
jgi:beta-lactamase class D